MASPATSHPADASDAADGLVDRIRALQPLIREHAPRTEQERRVTSEVVAALTDAGLYRMNVPRRYGGYQSPCTPRSTPCPRQPPPAARPASWP